MRPGRLEMNERVVVVTGSSTGIGRAIALRIAAEGARVIVHGRTDSVQLDQTLAQIRETGGTAAAVTCDFQNEDLVGSFPARASQPFGTPHVWINNAGGDVLTGGGPDMSLPEKLEFLWKVDVRASLILSRAAGRLMFDAAGDVDAEDRPSLINIGWDQAWTGMSGESGELFATTKGAVMAMTLSLAKSLAPRVRVNCIAPGWIKTEWGESAPAEWAERAVSESLMQRWGTPEDVAAVALFLAGRDSSFITGQVLNVNGGFRTCDDQEVL